MSFRMPSLICSILLTQDVMLFRYQSFFFLVKVSQNNINYSTKKLLKQCMQTSNSFLTNFVEQNIIDKFGKIALLTKKPRFDLLYFQNQYDEVYSIQFFQEILNCIQQWQTKSRYYESIYRNLVKQNIVFILQNQQKMPQSISLQMQQGSVQNLSQKKYQKQFPQLSLGDRVKLKIKLLQDSLYFMYSCFVMQKMSDEISQILLVCNDLIISIDQEKEQLQMQNHSSEQINQIQKLQILLQTMNQNYTNGEPIQTYVKNFKGVLAEVLDIQNQEEEEQKIKQTFFEEFGSIKSENFIASLNSLNQLDSDQLQNNQKIRSFNCISNQLSNFHLSLHNLTANNLDHVKHFDKSPCYKINLSRGQSNNYSSPNSPKKHQLSILGSLIEEKQPKKAPLIYGKLKSLKQETSNKQQKQSNNMYEQGTPETKCTTFYSVNESKENYSYFSSRNNSPQMFSTANPVLFQQIKDFPVDADEVMDEELPVRVSSQSHSQFSSQNQPDFSRRNTNSDFQSQQRISQQVIQNNIPVISYNLQSDSNQLNEYKTKFPQQQQVTQNRNQLNNNYFSTSSQNTSGVQNPFYIQNQTNNYKNSNIILQQSQDLQQFYQTCQQQIQQQNQQLYFTQQNQQHQMNYQKPQSLPQIFQAPQSNNFQNVSNEQKIISQLFTTQGSQLQQQQQQQTNYPINNTLCNNNLQTNFYNNNKNGSQIQVVNIQNQNNQIGNNYILSQSMISQQQQQYNQSLQNNKQLPLFTSGANNSNFNSQFNSQKNSVPNSPPKVPQAIPNQSNPLANSNIQTNQPNITHIQNSNQPSINQLKSVFGVPNSPNSQKQISKSILNLLSQQQTTIKNSNQINSNAFLNSYGMNNSNNGQFEQQISNTNGITLMCSNNSSLNNNSNSNQINIGINQSTINLAQTVMHHLQNNQNAGLINNNNYYQKYFGTKNQVDQQYQQQQQQIQMNNQKQAQKGIEVSLPNQAKPLNSQIVTKINQVIPNVQNKPNNDGSSKAIQQNSIQQITKIQKPSACQNLILNSQQTSNQAQQYYISSSNLGSPSKNTSTKNSLNNSTNRFSQPVLIQPSTNQRFNRSSQMNPSFQNAFAKTVNNTQNASLNSSFKNQSLNTSSSQKSNTILPKSQYTFNLQRMSQNQYYNN
ncbi:hypothetical protein TTHERM_00137930 (macronuclear) [Tetrahymena thermophila SB210]|uniref:Uncharacterized protein n=1 Tax=Tetrahymena thermophila (strain SB210) TaxID=312017 RepID=I7MF98_TETTS|nr:hypothetical protein TTHERM_00137930 [Tetrahymena thermophila SB210]EAR99530.2 hypothetical protein TTHERM_00137930 [Tetrahymena thermophila SB210]|eukprot:XP_001019775.2 hypothetical protein TTHERM_00137930 [Tetrahymena thermophila SB210]